jgi:hypothetical protein
VGAEFVACSSCSCSASLWIRFGFALWLDEVSDGPQQRRGQSASAWRTVRVLPADGLLFRVRYWRFCWLYRTVRGPGRTVRRTHVDSPRYLGGQSVWPVRVVRFSWPDGPPEPGCFALWFDSSILVVLAIGVCFVPSLVCDRDLSRV